MPLSRAAPSVSSSDYNGPWNPPRARDGLWTDPGWHSSGYTQPVEWLRADLGVARPVDGVAYVPRVMSASPGDGSWNGVYRGWEIYVTDSASSDPVQWGALAAVGFIPGRARRPSRAPASALPHARAHLCGGRNLRSGRARAGPRRSTGTPGG
jgi:hypothetical protein